MSDTADLLEFLSAPHVGLGCASFGGSLSAQDSMPVLDAAAESGIRYLDVARSYGYGEAEGAVGEFLRHVDRADYVVATKAGIRPPGSKRVLDGLRFGARALARVSPAARRRVARLANTTTRAGRFAPADLERSLHESLTALRTDRVDVLHLHECRPGDVTDEVVAWLEGRVSAGEVRTWGIATSAADAAEITSRFPVPVVQIPAQLGSAWLPDPLDEGPRLIRHSILRGWLDPVRSLLADAGETHRWSERLGLTVDAETAPQLLLRIALTLPPVGVVLVGTRRPSRARALGTTLPLEAAQLAAAQQLLQAATVHGH